MNLQSRKTFAKSWTTKSKYTRPYQDFDAQKSMDDPAYLDVLNNFRT